MDKVNQINASQRKLLRIHNNLKNAFFRFENSRVGSSGFVHERQWNIQVKILSRPLYIYSLDCFIKACISNSFVFTVATVAVYKP